MVCTKVSGWVGSEAWVWVWQWVWLTDLSGVVIHGEPVVWEPGLKLVYEGPYREWPTQQDNSERETK